MSKRLFGYNVLKVDDKAAFKVHQAKLQAPAHLFYGPELDFAREMKRDFPDLITIIRNWPDSELHKRYTPTQWIREHETQAAGGLYLYTMNESGLSQEVIDWHLELMDIAIAKGIHLVLLNPATGTWDKPDYARLAPLFRKASEHKDLFIIGLHAYAGGVITSGLLGGYPGNAGIASSPNDAPGTKGRNLIPRDKWPKRDEILHMTTFHLGRHSWLMNYCESIGLKGDKMPRFALTETGFDYLGDIGAWLNTLNHAGYDSVNGWRTLTEQWWQWFGIREQAYTEQFQYAAESLLNGLEFALFYAYGDDGNWPNYNIANSSIPERLELLYAGATTPPHDKPPRPGSVLDTAALLAIVSDIEDELIYLAGSISSMRKAIGLLKEALK